MLLLVSVIFFACNVKDKETVYENYSLEQLQENLKGRWRDSTQKQDDPKRPYVWEFQFVDSDLGRFQGMRIDGDKVNLIKDSPSFTIYNGDGYWWIKFHSFNSNGAPKAHRITKISNQRLILSEGGKNTTYLKMP